MSAPETPEGEADSLETLTAHLARHTRHTRAGSTASLEVRCCCGRAECAFVRKTQEMLGELEKDLKVAGSLGKALLERHEHSIDQATQEKRQMATAIAALEAKTLGLESENARTIEENKTLLAELEDINTGMCMSEARVRELQDDLDSAHTDLSRISAAASRTSVLEAQLAVLESEQAELRNVLATTQEEEKEAVARWKKAERALSQLEVQLDTIERDNAMEKARAGNILERLEKRQFASKANDGSYPNALAERTALSRFMREILAENSSLQAGAAELRELLLHSQEECNALREQIDGMEVDAMRAPGKSPLSTELARSPNGKAVQTIVHHHHYHTPETPSPRQPSRRPKKKRSEKFPTQKSFAASPSMPFVQKWAVKRSTTAPTVPSFSTSPESSAFHESSIFDTMAESSSRPTSADSNYGFKYSPKFPRSRHAQHPSMSSAGAAPPFSILHTTEEIDDAGYSSDDTSSPIQRTTRQPKLKRAVSHESLLSIVDTYSPALSASSHSTVGKSPQFQPTAAADAVAQTTVTPGIAISGPSSRLGSSAYSRLLGLSQQESNGTSPPPVAASPQQGRWLPWGWKPKMQRAGSRRKPAGGLGPQKVFVDEEMLRESLGEVREGV